MLEEICAVATSAVKTEDGFKAAALNQHHELQVLESPFDCSSMSIKCEKMKVYPSSCQTQMVLMP